MNKIPATKIIVERLEGYTEECIAREFDTFRRANLCLVRNSLTAPKDGAYDKHKIVVTFADGETYEARMDLHHPSYERPEKIEDHITWFCRFHGGLIQPNELPKHISQEYYLCVCKDPDAKGYREFLSKYRLED